MFLGEFAALLGSFCWATGSTFFTFAVKRLGVFWLNFIRLFFALTFLTISLLIYQGTFYPTMATKEEWFWLGTSGIIGLAIGDLFYFASLKEMGPRLTMLLFTLAPPVAAIGELLVWGKTVGILGVAGMLITIFGIAYVVSERKNGSSGNGSGITKKGVIFGAGAAFCQGVGLILSKIGLANLDALNGTYIRMVVSFPIFALILFFFGKSYKEIPEIRKGIAFAMGGAMFGPFLGVTLSLVAAKYAYVAVAMTILSTTPITILPYSVLIFKEKLTQRAIIGAVSAVIGVALLTFTK